ncbi:MAG TPA: beta-phosphoglucomutase [Cyclobacteriaceae bacterium]|nr:beta-phosphoglucomutase [Cyclobacteriaceae bacterium]
MNQTLEAVIFDLDGVIVDTAKYHYLAWKRLAKELGYDLSEADNEHLKGVSRMRSLEIILELAGVSKSVAEMEEMAFRKNEWFKDYIKSIKPEEIFEGIPELIKDIKSNNKKIALASSSKNAQEVIQLLQIADVFDAVVDGNMIEHTKPDPEIFLLAAKKLDLPPAQCVVIEDAEAGVEAALAAGMKCVGVGHPNQLGKANLVIPNMQQLQYADLLNL